jgi:hypothetical protein
LPVADNTELEPYEAPDLTDYGTIDEWTQGLKAQIIHISVIV